MTAWRWSVAAAAVVAALLWASAGESTAVTSNGDLATSTQAHSTTAHVAAKTHVAAKQRPRLDNQHPPPRAHIVDETDDIDRGDRALAQAYTREHRDIAWAVPRELAITARLGAISGRFAVNGTEPVEVTELQCRRSLCLVSVRIAKEGVFHTFVHAVMDMSSFKDAQRMAFSNFQKREDVAEHIHKISFYLQFPR